jgi:threonine 3-dehydrogenase
VPLTAKTVLITGCGPQGLMAIAIAAASGAKQIMATEVSPKRLNLAWEVLRQHLGDDDRHTKSQARKDLILNAADRNLISQIYEATDGLGVDVLLETAGHASAIRDGLAVLRTGSHAVILGLASDTIELNWNELVFKAVTVHFRYGRKLYETWTDGRRLLESGAVRLEALVYKPYFTLAQFKDAFDLLLQGDAAKVIFTPNGS